MSCLRFLQRGAASLVGLALLTLSPAVLATLREVPDDLAVTAVNRPVLIDVLANDRTLGEDLRLINANGFRNGHARIEGDRIRYTPNPGFTGTDSFRYNVFVGGNGKPAQGTVTVLVGQGSAVTLVGQVVDEPVPNATVTVLVGGYEFVAQADGDGFYRIDIASLQPDAFITLVGEGVSASGVPLTFYSVVGELARLVTEAGSDGVLTRDENNQVSVTNLSTAQYVLMTDANGGTPITSDEQLIPLTQAVEIEALLELAAVIKLIVDEGLPLPAGSTDLLDLLGDPAAVEAFIVSLPPGTLEDTVAGIVTDPAVTPAFVAGRLPAGYTLLVPSAAGTIRVGVEHNGVLRFEDSATQTQGVLTGVDSRGPFDLPLTWAIDNGSLLVTSPAATWEGPFDRSHAFGSCAGRPYRVTERFVSFRITRLQQGVGVDYLETVETLEQLFSDPDPGDGCAPPASGVNAYPALRLGFQDGAGELPFTAADLGGKRMLQYFSPDVLLNQQQGLNPWGVAVFDFDTGTVLINNQVLNFAPTLDNGRIEFSLPDTVSSDVVHYSFARLQRDGRKGDGLLARATRADGTPVASYSLSAVVDGTLFSSGTMPAEWRSGFDVSQFAGDGTEEFGFFIVLNADGSGWQRTVNADGSILENFRTSGWTVDGSGVMRLRSVRSTSDPGGVFRASCPIGANCFDRRIRQWTPIATDGDRIYVLEQFTEQFGLFSPPAMTAQRANFYQR